MRAIIRLTNQKEKLFMEQNLLESLIKHAETRAKFTLRETANMKYSEGTNGSIWEGPSIIKGIVKNLTDDELAQLNKELICKVRKTTDALTRRCCELVGEVLANESISRKSNNNTLGR